MTASPHSVDNAPIVLGCSLHLRREGDYCRGLVRVEEDGRVLFDEYVSTRGLIASLLGDSDEPIMTCTCTVPECAGFYDQESRLGETFIRWTLRYGGEVLDLAFDRETYEDEALAVLWDFKEHPWGHCEFGTVPDEYDGYEDFTGVLDDLLARSPRLTDNGSDR